MAVPLHVTEWMKGYVGLGAKDVDAGFIKGFDEETLFMHKILIQIDDIDAFVADPKHSAKVDGAISCAAFGGTCKVTDGTFNMLVDGRNPNLKLMLYRLPFKNSEGTELTLLGQKTIRDDHGMDLLQDITRLNVRIYDGLVPGLDVTDTGDLKASAAPPPPPIAMGVLHIETLDAFRSARSFRSPGSTKLDAAKAIQKFGAFYMDRLWTVYGKTALHPE